MTRSLKYKYILTALLAAGLILGSTSTSAAVQRSPVHADTPTLNVIVAFDHQPGSADRQLFRSLGGQVSHSYNVIPAIAGKLPQQALEALLRNPHVTQIEPDSPVYALDYVAAEELNNSWGVKRIGAGAVHLTGNLGDAVKVAVLDSGVDFTHQDLNDNFLPGELGHDFVEGTSDTDGPMDVYGHGTHVAGTIAAECDSHGVIGVAPKVQLIALRILDDNGVGASSRVLDALDWIWAYNQDPQNADQPIRVTNNSYGNSTYSELAMLAFDKVAQSGSGVLHIAASGNSGKKNITLDTVSYPAKYPSVVAVAATDKLDARASFSSTGPDVELAAPGVSVLSTWMRSTSYLDPQPFAFPGDDDYYKEGSGTSMAAPHVAGTAALMWAANPTLSSDAVRMLLNQTAIDLGSSGRDYAFGFGLVDASAAVAAATGADPVVPDPTTDPITVSAISGSAVWLNAATWRATCTVIVGPAVPNAFISAKWSNGTTASGVTDGAGTAVFTLTSNKKVSSASMTVENITLEGYVFEASGMDSITILKP